MAKEYDNTNRASLFINRNRTKESQPHLTGKININGVEHWFSAWKKHGDNCGAWYSCSIGEVIEDKPAEPMTDDDFDDDVPF